MRKRIRDSLRIKVFLWISGLLILSSLLIYGIAMAFLPDSYTVVSSDRLNQEIDELTKQMEMSGYDGAKEQLEAFCAENHATAVISGDGTDEWLGGLKKDYSAEDVLTYSVEMTFADRTGIRYAITVAVPFSAREDLTDAFLRMLPPVLAVIFFISFLGAWLCSRILVKPIEKISRISGQMAKLDMTWDCRMNRTDEIGVLADSLNTMSEQLGKTMEDLEKANEQLQEDVRHISGLYRQRRDFFAAASHELKTPITILKGQIESMLLGIGRYKNVEEILPETLKEVENMERLVKEILSISKMEIDGLTGQKTKVSLSDTAVKILETLEPLAREKKIRIERDIYEPLYIEGNLLMLEKALHNIFSNAIRHSPDGAEVYLAAREGELSVENTNVFIPEETKEDLFSPFYRVERSRNKETGGSGLGLYIVKTILDLHRLSWGMENTKRGVRFYIRLNQN